MRQSGYNVVRVYLNYQEVGQHTPPGTMHGAYLANVTDFLGLAMRHGIRVIVTTQWVPQSYYELYKDKSNGLALDNFNAQFLNPAHLLASEHFLGDFAQHVVSQGLQQAVFAYDLINEGNYDSNLAPLNKTDGEFRAPNGKTYDLSVPEERQELADASAIYYTNLITRAIKTADPGALTTLSLFSPRAVGKSSAGGLPVPAKVDPRYPFRWSKMALTRIDFFDLHFYPKNAGELTADIETLEVNLRTSKKPLVAGEFGSLSSTKIAEAAERARMFMRTVCAHGFTGWLYWTWDTMSEAGGHTFHTLRGHDGALNGVIAPTANPLPCNFEPVAAQPWSGCYAEQHYLDANRDVAEAVQNGAFASGFTHFMLHGRAEGRSGCPTPPEAESGTTGRQLATQPHDPVSASDSSEAGEPTRSADPIGAEPTASSADTRLPVHRFYETATGNHFLTLRREEVAAGFVYEGVAFDVFRSPAAGRQALYRCRMGFDHFTSTAKDCEGQTVEGRYGWIAKQRVRDADRPLYRCIHPNGNHLSTTARSECRAGGYSIEGRQGFVP
jgi:hypothetical protein